MAGLTSSGLTIKTQAEILDDIKTAIAASPDLNPNGRINLEVDSVLGVLASIFADKIAELWQVTQAVYGSQYRSSAEGDSLDALAELIGAARVPAAGSIVTLTGTGTNGTSITAGSIVADPDRAGIEWVTLTTVVIASGVFSVQAQCSTNGPIAANAGTLTSIVTPISGWSTATNPADAALGRNAQTDAALRQDMVDLLFAVGSSTPSAIRSAVLAVAGVTEAFVFENPTDTVNAFGVPPHNIEVVVDGGTDAAVAQAIYDNRAAGIGTYSATSDSAVVTDVNGDSVTIEFSRPVEVDVYVYVQIESNDENVDVEAEVKAAIAAAGDNVTVGQKVRRSSFFSAVYGVAGVTNVTRLGVSSVDAAGALAAATTLADITIAFRERAVFDTTRIVVAVL